MTNKNLVVLAVAAIALGGAAFVVAVDGQSAGQHGHIGLEGVGRIGRDAVPHPQIHVADTLLGILLAVQNTLGQPQAARAVCLVDHLKRTVGAFP